MNSIVGPYPILTGYHKEIKGLSRKLKMLTEDYDGFRVWVPLSATSVGMDGKFTIKVETTGATTTQYLTGTIVGMV